MDTGDVHGVMIRAAFSDFSEGARLRITGEAPPAADLIWGDNHCVRRGCEGCSEPKEEPAKTPQYSKRPRKSKNAIRKETKEDFAELLVPPGGCGKEQRAGLPCPTCGHHYDDLAGYQA